MAFSFRGGVSPNPNKNTENCSIDLFPLPKTLCVPVSQHIGKPATACVAVGDTVVKGQLIAVADGNFSANIYSPATAVVSGFETLPLFNGNSCVHILLDVCNEQKPPLTLEPIADFDKDKIFKRVKDAGIVGMGGATFPTHIKLSPQKTVNTLIVNAAECEPYITCDYRVILEHTADVVEGAKLEAAALNVNNILIALTKVIGNDSGITVVRLKTKYPQGSEKQLIYALTRRVVPQGGLPSDIGVVVSNVQTVFAVCRAVRHGEPLVERVTTFSGNAAQNKGNFVVPVGTPVSTIMDFAKVSNAEKVISGGVMMGFALCDFGVTSGKGSSAFLFLTHDEINNSPISACINCGRCHRACPLSLMPMYIDGFAAAGELDAAKKYGALDCFECGCCAYVCPAKRPLVQSIRLAKKLLREKKH